MITRTPGQSLEPRKIVGRVLRCERGECGRPECVGCGAVVRPGGYQLFLRRQRQQKQREEHARTQNEPEQLSLGLGTSPNLTT